MAQFVSEVSRTFSEYLLLPRHSTCSCVPHNVSLLTPLAKYKRGQQPSIFISIPIISAIMQSVFSVDLAVALAQEGGIAFAHCSQSVESEVNMIRQAKFAAEAISKKQNNDVLNSNIHYLVGAGINTRDYKERVPALLDAGADVLCIDSSDGYSDWQKNTLLWIRETYGNGVVVGAGNIVDAEGFRFLANCGADFIKVGVGGGSICITRETKGIGRGQASALIDVCSERDKYFEETDIYIPICSDGGIAYDHHITLALAMGANFVMLGRYFAGLEESPTKKIMIDGTYYKEYWGEGSDRARNWQRYDLGGEKRLSFPEGVDSYVPYSGSLHESITMTTNKIRATMCNCGALTIPDLQDRAILTLVSPSSIVEGSAHDVILRSKL